MMGLEEVRLSYSVPVTFQGAIELLNFGRVRSNVHNQTARVFITPLKFQHGKDAKINGSLSNGTSDSLGVFVPWDFQ